MFKQSRLFLCFFLVLNLVLMEIGSVSVSAKGEKLGMGLLQPTPAQTEWLKNNVPVVQKFRLNELAVQRINSERQTHGQHALNRSDVDIAELGNEAIISSSDSLDQTINAGDTELIGLPGSVDNSLSSAFPPIRSQGSLGSCAAWASTYYQMTYETNLALGRTASGGDNTVIFSPKWSYNMVNGGSNSGSSFASIFDLEMKNGAVTWSQFPYDTNYRAWCLDESSWNDAINYRTLKVQQIATSDVDTTISQIKTALADGHILVFATYVSSWVQKTVANDPSTSLDDPYSGQYIASYCTNTNSGGHGMTIVGYNDNIWCDLNGNSVVDSGEKGAFKIANSWGTGDWNSGYRWVTYDSLRATSAVSANGTWPTTNRSTTGIFWSNSVYALTVNSEYTPLLKAEVTLNHAKRGEMAVTLGVSTTASTTPTTTWNSKALYYSGGNYAFDGTTTAIDGSFYFDLTNLSNSTTNAKRWFVGISDSTSGSAATIKSFKLYRGNDLVGTSTGTPLTIDSGKSYVWIDYTFDNTNLTPVASASASVTSGTVPLTVTFDGSASQDPDGQISSYSWNFGDGSTAAIVSPVHTYTLAGNYIASLTVTDNQGASSSNSILIAVSAAANQSPVAYAAASVSSGTVPLTVTFDGSDSQDPDGQIASYSWNFGDGSSAPTVSPVHIYTVAGNYVASLTVTDNQGASNSISVLIAVSAAANQSPVASAAASVTSGTIPLDVTFDGSASQDPDGQIASYLWDFGDGSTASTVSPVHTYTVAGNYIASLTVTDNQGASSSISLVITANSVAPTTGQISGTVKDATTKSGISGATVTDGVRTSLTAADGSFSIANVPAGSYTVTSSATGYKSASSSVSVLAGQTTTAAFSLSATSSTSIWVQSITYVPATSYMDITVKVVNPQPVSGARLTMRITHGKTAVIMGKTTNTGGEATFRIYYSTKVTWVTKVNSLILTGYTWDTAQGIKSSTYTP